MASLWKHPKSPFWTACYTDETGKQRKISTKQKDRKMAAKVAETLEESARKASFGELTRGVATKEINKMMERMNLEGLDLRSTAVCCTDYLERLENRGTRASTIQRYKPIFDGFLAHIGEVRSKARLASITSQELEAFRDAEMKAGKTASTANLALKVLNGLFEEARRKAVIPHNPVQAVARIQAFSNEERGTFTDDQVKSLLAASNLEWQGMILFAYHTGMRLTDISALTWNNVADDILAFLDKKTSHRKQRKSERETRMIMPQDLHNYLDALSKGPAEAPIFPSLFGQKAGSSGGLSNAFMRLMKKAGIDPKPGKEKKGKGRTVNALTFHSFRHTMITRIALSDAPAAVRKRLTGHASDEAHQIYIHLEIEAQKQVMNSAPRLWNPSKQRQPSIPANDGLPGDTR